MLTSWRAYFTGGLGVTDTEMKFICLGLLRMKLNHARGAWEEADLSQAVHIIWLSKSNDNGLEKIQMK